MCRAKCRIHTWYLLCAVSTMAMSGCMFLAQVTCSVTILLGCEAQVKPQNGRLDRNHILVNLAFFDT